VAPGYFFVTTGMGWRLPHAGAEAAQAEASDRRHSGKSKPPCAAYVAATGVVPVSQEMIRYIPNGWPGPVRDVMAATRTTVQNEGKLREIGLWPWGRVLVATGVVDGFEETKRGLQSEAKDGHWCLSIFERQVTTSSPITVSIMNTSRNGQCIPSSTHAERSVPTGGCQTAR
jgi:hypothetical protein